MVHSFIDRLGNGRYELAPPEKPLIVSSRAMATHARSVEESLVSDRLGVSRGRGEANGAFRCIPGTLWPGSNGYRRDTGVQNPVRVRHHFFFPSASKKNEPTYITPSMNHGIRTSAITG
jgi:hypothetical protein